MYHALRRRKKVGQRQPIHLPRHRLYRSYNREISNRLAKLGVFSHVSTSLPIYRTVHKFHAMTVIGTKRYRRSRERSRADCRRRQTTLSRSFRSSFRTEQGACIAIETAPACLLFFFAAEETFVRAAEVTTIFRASGLSRIIIATAYQSVRRRRERIARYMRSHDRAHNYMRRSLLASS